MSIDIEKVRKFFFKAMVVGWVADGEEDRSNSIPGLKEIHYCDGSLQLVDSFVVNSDAGKSAGQTMIFRLEKDMSPRPLWYMSYGGRYEKRAIPFLKQVLKDSYKEKLFHGCRGPQFVDGSDMSYHNELTGETTTFSQFGGREKIVEHRTNRMLGYHQYYGMSLM